MKQNVYPDIQASESSVTEQIKWLKKYGVIVLRQAISTDEIKPWLTQFKQAFEKSDKAFITGQMQDHQYQQLYRYGHPRPEDIPDVADWHHWLLSQSTLKDLLQSLYQDTIWILQKNSLPRRQQTQAPEQAIAFHQDYEFIGPMRSGLNCWIPLSPSGGEYPGLEIWLKSPQEPLFSLSQSSAEREKISSQIPDSDLWHPCLEPGDLLIMTLFTVHRTYLPPHADKRRFSYELRLIGTQDHGLTCSPLIERTL